MDLEDLEQGLRSVSSSGNVLSCEQLTSIQAGLTLLKGKEKLKAVYLWGKFLGKEADYWVAYGLTESKLEYPTKMFYYAGEDYDFKALPMITEEVGEAITMLNLTGPLTGLPSTILEMFVEEGMENEAPMAPAMKVTELERLSLLVQEIDFDTAVVPKGAHSLSEAQIVVTSNQFQGLDVSKASSLENYVHFRPPASVASLKAHAQSDLQFYSNFLDPLSSDLPKGCWVVRQDPTGALVTLRSLTWPGYQAFHVPGTTKFGGVYFGDATKNTDLAFLL